MPATIPELRNDPAAGPLFWATALGMIGIAACFHLTRFDAWAGPGAQAAWRPRELHEVVAVPDEVMKPIAVIDGAVLYAPSADARPPGGGGGAARGATAYVRLASGKYLPVDHR